MPADGDTIPRLLGRRRRGDPDLRVLVDDRGSITFAELDDTSRGLAARLVAAGIAKGDRVGLLMPNGIGWATTALAVMRIGAVLVPLSTLLRPPELLAQLNLAAVTHLVAVPAHRGRSYLDDLEVAAPGLAERTAAGRRHPAAPFLRSVWPADELSADMTSPGAVRRAAEDGLPTDATPATALATGEMLSTDAAATAVMGAMEGTVRPADDMVVLFTSGSRGAPKGVIHTHGNALRATAAGLDARRVRPGERLYIPMPFFWTGGFAGGLLTVLVAGATLVTESAPEPARTIELLQRERVTLFRGWPDQAARLAANPAFIGADLSLLRSGSLGAVLPADRRPPPGARASLFGMTETFGPYCGDRLDVDLPPAKHGSCGGPFAGVELQIVDPDTGEEVAPGTQGEIWVRGPNMMRGICGRDRSTLFTVDGFYRTGDLGQLDEDGYLWYAGRLDDMFKVKGATVYPSEVEAALRALPDVTQVFVTNILTDDGHDQVAALVVTTTDVPTLAAAARTRLSSFKVPSVWLVTTDPAAVPTSPTGKVDKPRLQNLLHTHGTPPPPTHTN